MTGMESPSVILSPAEQGMKRWYQRWLRGAFVEAHAALGERMYALGIDDGEHGTKINALDKLLHQAELGGGAAQALKAARRQLVLQLAAAALADDGPLPGADAEYRRAKEAQAALEENE